MSYGYHPGIIFNNKFFLQKMNYIQYIPVVVGLVSKPEDYYSSVRKHTVLDASLEIIFENPLLISY